MSEEPVSEGTVNDDLGDLTGYYVPTVGNGLLNDEAGYLCAVFADLAEGTLDPQTCADLANFAAGYTMSKVDRMTGEENCGGCRGEGNHKRHCIRNPDFHPFKRLADRAEAIGDSVGQPGLANRAWDLAARLRAGAEDHPFRRPAPHA